MKFSVKIAGIFAVVAFALTAVSANAAFTRDLTMGSTGADVIELQTILEQGKYLTIPAGTSKGYFGQLTKDAVIKWQTAVGLPATGYFGPMSKAKIGAAPVTPGAGSDSDSDLSGSDGDIQNIDETTSGTETTLGESKTEDVIGFDLEADDNSDLEVSSVKVEIATEAGESTRLSKYLEEVAITVDGEEVGMADVSDFSRDGATSTVTISLDNTVVEAGEEVRFYVTLTASDSINDSELDAQLNVEVTRVRVEDASGAVLTEDIDDISTTVDFEDATADDDARIKSSSDSRDAGLLKVEANKSSENFDVLTFNFDIDEDSSDLVVLEIPVNLAIENAADAILDVEAMIKDMSIEVGGETYDDYEFESDVSIAAEGDETVTVTFTIDEGDLEIAAGDVVEAVLFVELNEQDGNYAEGTTIDASVVGSAIVAENPEGDVFEVDGTVNGEAQTLQISAATVEEFEWSPSTNSDGTVIDFYFTVTAEDEDFTVLASSIDDTIFGTATTSAGVLSLSTGDADEEEAGVEYIVLDGDTATFRVRYSITGTVNGTYSEVKVTSVAGQELPTGDQRSKTVTVNLN